ncbi:GLPGLI family protein [Lutibacter sp.]
MKIILIILLVTSCFFNALGQNKNQGRAYYSRQSGFSFAGNKEMDSVAIAKKDSEIMGLMNFSNGNFQYILEFTNNESKFKLEDKLNLDNNELRFARMFGGAGVYYSNVVSKESIRQVESFGDLFLISRNLNLVEWELFNETKIIGEFLCYKATTVKIVENRKVFKKEVVAWYCPEIPVPYGPIGYGKLPGLIIELSIEGEATYLLNKIELNPTIKIEIMKPIKGTKVNETEYNEIGKTIFEKMIKRKL